MSLQRFANAPVPSSPSTAWSTLSFGLDATTTTVVPVDTSLFPSLSQFVILIDDELMLVTTAGSSWTVTRHYESTTPATHAAGASIFHVLSAASLLRNPRSMTTLGDFEYLDATGAPARLGQPGNGQWAVTFTAGVPSWTAVSAPDLSAYATTAYVDTRDAVVTALIPTNNNQLTNGAGYLTSVTAHNLLSATHGDTLTGAVLRGDMVVGNSTPKWGRVAIGTVGKVWQSDGTDAAWATPTGTGVPVLATGPTLVAPVTVTGVVGSSAITITYPAVGVTSIDGLVLTNTTAAAAGAQQWSPRIRWTGAGWKTDATAASRTVDWIAELQTAQYLNAPYHALVFSSQINGGGYSAQVALGVGGLSVSANAAVFGKGTWNSDAFIGQDFYFENSLGFYIKSTDFIGFSSTTPGGASVAVDVKMFRDAANTLALRNSTTAQTFNVYNTWTDASNYERTAFMWSSNVGWIQFQAAGTGNVNRSMRFGTTGGYFQTSDSVGLSAAWSNGSNVSQTQWLNGNIQFTVGSTNILGLNSSGSLRVTLADAVNIELNTTTGTKIGTATSQKLALWNKTPIVQPTTSITGAARVGGGGTALTDTDTFGGYTVAQLAAVIINSGLAA